MNETVPKFCINDIYIKHALEKYQLYNRRRNEIAAKIQQIDDRMQRIPGSVIKLPEENQCSNRESKWIADITLKTPLLAKFEELSIPIGLVEDMIAEELMYGKILHDKYIEGETQGWLSDKYSYSPRSISRIVDECVQVYLIRLKNKQPKM